MLPDEGTGGPVERRGVAGVLLAAGEGSRFRSSATDDDPDDHKLTAAFGGRPVAAWALEAADGAGFNHLYVVTGAADLTPIVAETVGDRATVVHNERWAEGQATSLAVAIDRADADGHRAVVVGLADQPMVPASAWRTVGAAAGPIVTAVFDGHRRPPVKFEHTVWDLLPRTGDEGARALLRLRPELVSGVPCTGNAFDIDTWEDLRRWNSPMNS